MGLWTFKSLVCLHTFTRLHNSKIHFRV